MPMNQQRQIIHLMHCMQNGAVLTIGPFSELDYEMATDVNEFFPNFCRFREFKPFN